MAKAPAKPTADIQRLLEEKRRIEQWLERLNMAADQAPQQVREKVAGDYRKRLEALVDELQGYREELASTLQAQLARRDELRQREAQETERLSEAELRHTVGEYDEAKWSDLKTQILESLVQVRETLKAVDGEIKMLEGVVALLEPGGGALGMFGEEEAPQPQPARSPEKRTPVPPSRRETPAVAGAAPPAGGESPPEGQTDAFDELAFLKSVSGEREGDSSALRGGLAGGAPRRGSGGLPAVGDGGLPPLGTEGVPSLSVPERAPSRTSAKKTLKCVECGTMNLATEWYCERCGAELAAL
jgi:hypothetical protein